jgi:hypothetical protein
LTYSQASWSRATASGRYVRRYAVNGAALVLVGAGHWLTDERPDELAAASLGAFSEVGEANAGQVPSKNVIVQPHGPHLASASS